MKLVMPTSDHQARVRVSHVTTDKHLTDWHCHILSGVDDGAKSNADSLEMARLLAAAGFKEVCCTPHRMRGVWDPSPAIIRVSTSALQDELDKHNVPLTLHPGSEYYLDESLPEFLKDPLLLPGGLLLVELPSCCDIHLAQRILAKVLRLGFTPLIAHPERCFLTEQRLAKKQTTAGLLKNFFKTNHAKKVAEMLQQTLLLQSLQEMGCCFQGNLGSFAGVYGKAVKNAAVSFLKAGIYSYIGSDGHAPGRLSQIISSGRDEIERLGKHHLIRADHKHIIDKE